MDGWMGGWVGGWVGGRAGLRIAYSNQKLMILGSFRSHVFSFFDINSKFVKFYLEAFHFTSDDYSATMSENRTFPVFEHPKNVQF